MLKNKNLEVSMTKAGRNDPCPCGSGKKFKRCCEAGSATKKIEAKVLSASSGSPTTEGASKISRSFFQNVKQPILRKDHEEKQ
jgi:hypothetical protein